MQIGPRLRNWLALQIATVARWLLKLAGWLGWSGDESWIRPSGELGPNNVSAKSVPVGGRSPIWSDPRGGIKSAPPKHWLDDLQRLKTGETDVLTVRGSKSQCKEIPPSEVGDVRQLQEEVSCDAIARPQIPLPLEFRYPLPPVSNLPKDALSPAAGGALAEAQLREPPSPKKTRKDKTVRFAAAEPTKTRTQPPFVLVTTSRQEIASDDSFMKSPPLDPPQDNHWLPVILPQEENEADIRRFERLRRERMTKLICEQRA